MTDGLELGKTLYYLYEEQWFSFNPEYKRTPEFIREIIFGLTAGEEGEEKMKVEEIDTSELKENCDKHLSLIKK